MPESAWTLICRLGGSRKAPSRAPVGFSCSRAQLYETQTIPRSRWQWVSAVNITIYSQQFRVDSQKKKKLGSTNHSLIFQPLLFFFLAATAWHMRASFPNQRLNPGPWWWKPRVLATGPPGSSQPTFAFKWVWLQIGSSEMFWPQHLSTLIKLLKVLRSFCSHVLFWSIFTTLEIATKNLN